MIVIVTLISPPSMFCRHLSRTKANNFTTGVCYQFDLLTYYPGEAIVFIVIVLTLEGDNPCGRC